jgi:hypothetical protein
MHLGYARQRHCEHELRAMIAFGRERSDISTLDFAAIDPQSLLTKRLDTFYAKDITRYRIQDVYIICPCSNFETTKTMNLQAVPGEPLRAQVLGRRKKSSKIMAASLTFEIGR